MKVSKLMTPSPVHACHAETTLNEACQLLWDHDCGILPVVDDEARVVGTITDRDICMAAYTTNQPLSNLPVERAMAHQVFTCKDSDDLTRALQLMQANRIRRLPVVDGEERLVGLLSLNDLALGARSGSVDRKQLADTMAAICEPRSRVEVSPPELVTA